MQGEIKFDPTALSRARYRNVMTQQDLADAAGLTVSTVNRIEKGIQEPRLSTIRKLAKALNVGPLDLTTSRSVIEIDAADQAFDNLEKKLAA